MPTMRSFYGITIRMYFDDHGPPHFHAYDQAHEARFGVDPVRLLSGGLPRRAQTLVQEWAALHLDALRENWRRAEAHEPLNRIEPLE